MAGSGPGGRGPGPGPGGRQFDGPQSQRVQRGAATAPGGGTRMRPKPNAAPDDLAFGINSRTALRTGFVRLVEYLEDSGAERLHEFLAEAEADGVPIRPVTLERLDELTAGGVHQGVLARLHALPDLSLGELAKAAAVLRS